ncbi:phosphatidylglycerophosphatase A family protein [Pasteurella bettyae]|uniref:phosphatidylglycerophosphatase A family protein n=1 Tax=Pasteurella bettyae TaxID=752 RepID=UPI003D2838A5
MKSFNSSSEALSRVTLRNPIHFFALGLGSGLLHPAPGTWGSFVAVIIGAFLLSFMGNTAFLIFTVASFFIGIYFCQKTSDDMGVHDHGAIVWDEFVAVWLVLLTVPAINWQWCLIAFVIFRLFDILKPFPIRYFDNKLESGFGIMIDDVLAAIYSIMVIWFIHQY